MPTEKPRYCITVDDETLKEIDDFRFENRYNSLQGNVHFCGEQHGDIQNPKEDSYNFVYLILFDSQHKTSEWMLLQF